MFVEYIDTTSQLQVYVLDLEYIIRSSVVEIDEDIPGGTIDLRIRNSPNGPKGTTTDLPDRKPAGRPGRLVERPVNTVPKDTVPVVSIPYTKPPIVTHTIIDDKEEQATEPNSDTMDYELDYPSDLVVQPKASSKRRRDSDDLDSEHQSKIVKAMIALIEESKEIGLPTIEVKGIKIPTTYK